MKKLPPLKIPPPEIPPISEPPPPIDFYKRPGCLVWIVFCVLATLMGTAVVWCEYTT